MANNAIAASNISATLASSSGANATSTISFKVYGPQATAPTDCTTGGTAVGTATPAGNGTYSSSAGFTPSSAGTYWWYASSTSDVHNNAAAGLCNSASMTKTAVTAAATMSARATANWDLSTTWLAVRTGTIATSNVNALVTGSSTHFVTELVAGDALFKSDLTMLGTIASITNDTQLTLTGNAASSNSGIAYDSSGRVPTAADGAVITRGFAVTVPNGVAASAKSVTIGGTSGSSSLTFASSTAVLTVAGDVVVDGSALNGQTQSLTVGAGSLAVGGNLSVAGGNGNPQAAMTVSTGSVNVGGDLAVSNTNTTFTAGTASTFSFDGSSAQTISNLAGIFGNVVVGGSGTKTAGSALSMSGNLVIGTGSTFAASTFSHVVKGNFTNNGTFTAGSSTLTFSGASPQTIGGSAATSFNNLTVGNAVGLSGVDATVSGTLALGTSVLTTGGNTVIVTSTSAGSVTRGATAGFVNGNLRKAVAAGSSTKTFEVGTGGTYTPITTLALVGANSGGTLTASSTVGQDPNYATSSLSATQYVNRYWTLTAGGGLTVTSYSLTLNFVAGDLVGSPSTLKVRRFVSGWTAPTSSSSTATSATATTFTTPSTFGNYAVGSLP